MTYGLSVTPKMYITFLSSDKSRRHTVTHSKELEKLRASQEMAQGASSSFSSEIIEEEDDIPAHTPHFRNENTLKIQAESLMNLDLNAELGHERGMTSVHSTFFTNPGSRQQSESTVIHGQYDRYQSQNELFQVFGQDLDDGLVEVNEPQDSYSDDDERSPELQPTPQPRRQVSFRQMDDDDNNDRDFQPMLERMKTLELQIKLREQEIAGKEEVINRKDLDIKLKNEEIRTKDEQIAEKEGMIKKKDQEIGELTETRQRLEKTLRDKKDKFDQNSALMKKYVEEIERLRRDMNGRKNSGRFMKCF